LKFKFTEKELKAVISLESNPDFQTILGALIRELDGSMTKTLFTPDSGVAEVERGHARALTMLLSTIESAREDVKKFTNH
jgi:hypothetical protein